MTGATIIHTRDRRRYVLAENCGVKRAWADIKAGRSMRCETSLWETRRREILRRSSIRTTLSFNPDNVVAVTES